MMGRRGQLPSMTAKTEQLQIRVTPHQKAALRRRASAAGVDLSSYVLARALPAESDRFMTILRAMEHPGDQRFALAELHDFLAACPPILFPGAVARAVPDTLSSWLRNYVAAMVEQAAARKQLPPPAWVRDVPPLETPWFATALPGLRMHLLAAAPVPFKRRNLFVDASIGDRV